MRGKIKSKNRSVRDLGERNLIIRVKIINSFNLSEDIFLKKYFCDRETLFIICLPSFKKYIREKADIKFISLYLSNLKKFITLLKSINEDNSNNSNTTKQNIEEKDKYIKLLKYVSEHIIYEKYASKRLIMRYGDIGDKFYIILHGLVSILTPIKINAQLTFNEYSRYIARLILYREYELAKITMKENKHIYNIDLPDIKFIIHYLNENADDDTYEKDDLYCYQQPKGLKSAKNVLFHRQKLGTKVQKYVLTKVEEEENRNLEVEKMIEAENASKIDRFMKKYLTKEEFSLFEEMKQKEKYTETDNDDTYITPETYINRLKNYKYTSNELISKKKVVVNIYQQSSKKIVFNKDDNFENIQATHNKNTVCIYEYQEINQLETGDMFGDAALSNNSSKRTATIISLVDSYFGCLDRDLYNSIKGSNDKNRKNMINYLIRTKIFKSLSYKTLDDKYLNFFAFKSAVMDEYIMKKEDINLNLIIIKNGAFEISFNGNLADIYDLINYYKDNFTDLTDKKYELNEFIFRKIYKLNENRRKIEKIFGEEKSICNELKLFIINSSSVFGLKESEQLCKDGHYMSFFNIKCLTSEGEYVLLDKRIFYKQIYGSDFKVKEETKLYIKEFAEKTINRLIHVLYSKIWHILTKIDMIDFRKLLYIGKRVKNKKKKNIMHEIGLDFHYMNKYDLTDIECIIEKIFNKYNENVFDNRNLSSYLYNYFENEKIESVQYKNLKKLEDEIYDIKKMNAVVKNLKFKQKKHFAKIFNFKRHNSIVNNQKFKNNENIPQLLSNNSSRNLKERKKILTSLSSGKLKNKLEKKSYSFFEDKTNNITQKMKNRNNLFLINNNCNNIKNTELSKNLSSGVSQGKTMIDSFLSDVSVNCNYCNYNNACISKINYNINSSENDFEMMKSHILQINVNEMIDQKMNRLFGGNEKYKSPINRCFSARNNSKANIFDSTHLSKEIYSDKRKEYILKNTRALFTRNGNFVQFQRRKKFIDNKVDIKLDNNIDKKLEKKVDKKV